MFHVFRVITKKLPFHFEHFLFEHFATDLRNGLEDRRKNSIVISLEKRSSQKWFFFTRHNRSDIRERGKLKPKIRFVPVLSKIRVKSNDQK